MTEAISRPTPAGSFPDAERQAIYDVIAARRDVRNFRPDPVPNDVLRRILAAAHQAPSVGFMQPWDFVVVTSPEKKAAIYDLFREANDRAARHYTGDRRDTYGALKLQGVLDAPLGICVTCDRARGGPHVLGRDSIPEMDLYSSCLAVENLWLAARAEGVGVGWVSIVDNAQLARALGLPPLVVPVAYLCVGYPVEFSPRAMLETIGWRERLTLDQVLHRDVWNQTAADVPASPALAPPVHDETRDDAWLASLLARVQPIDPASPARARTAARLDELTLPLGSLGHLGTLALQLAAIQEREYPSVARKALLVFAGDHGVTTEGVSAYRADVTAQLCYNFMAGGGVANALARAAGAELTVIDVGVAHDFGDATGLSHRKVRHGSGNMVHEPAATEDETIHAMRVGAESVMACDADIILLGEVGIGNTTAASALLAALTGSTAADVVGDGTGIGPETRDHKRAVVQAALDRHAESIHTPLGALAAVGGLEISALTGAILAAAATQRPVVLDGFITGVAALAAVQLQPSVRDYLIASHRSAERAHTIVLDTLALRPLLDLGLRIGEGSGAALAMPLIDAACRILREVRTFREAGIEPPRIPARLA